MAGAIAIIVALLLFPVVAAMGGVVVAALLGGLAYFQFVFKPNMIRSFLSQMKPPPATRRNRLRSMIETEERDIAGFRLVCDGSIVRTPLIFHNCPGDQMHPNQQTLEMFYGAFARLDPEPRRRRSRASWLLPGGRAAWGPRGVRGDHRHGGARPSGKAKGRGEHGIVFLQRGDPGDDRA